MSTHRKFYNEPTHTLVPILGLFYEMVQSNIRFEETLTASESMSYVTVSKTKNRIKNSASGCGECVTEEGQLFDDLHELESNQTAQQRCHSQNQLVQAG